MSQLFENAESILVSEKKLSDWVNNENQLQQSYIQDMQLLCTNKEKIKTDFHNKLLTYFDESINIEQQTTRTASINEASNLLRSVQGEQLEETVTIANLIAKAHKLHNEQLGVSKKRFHEIAPNKNIKKNNIPFGPEHLCNAFKHALNTQQPSSELIFVIYSLFDKYLIQKLDEVYCETNLTMRIAGILPNLMSEPGIDPFTHFLDEASRKTSIEKKDAQEKRISDNDTLHTKNIIKQKNDLFGTLQHLVMMKKHMILKNHRDIESISKNKQQTVQIESKTKTVFSTGELLDTLNILQQTPSNIDTLNSTHILDFIIQQSYEKTHVLSKKIDPIDEDTIELICLLFDSIESDLNVPKNMKQVIKKLKLPVMKVALSDKEFFNAINHPSRKLINKLAFSSICWNEMNNINEDPLYKKSSYIVNRILNDIHHNVEIYNDLANELTEFMDQEKNAGGAIEPAQDTQESVNVARSLIEDYIQNTEVPETIKNFLSHAWQHVLSHIHSNFGVTSMTWEYALNTTSQLISSTQPKLTQKEKQTLLQQIPGILNSIQDGLTLISYNRTKMQIFFTELELIHMASLKGELIDIYDLSSEETSDVPDINNDAENTPNIEQMIKEMDDATSRLENKKYVAKQEEDIYLDAVKKLAVGNWIEFSETNNKQFRVKLAWKNSTTGEFSFVDRNENIVTEKTLSELVKDFRNGHIHVINNSALIDRALNDTRLHLKKFVFKPNKYPERWK